MCRANQRAVYGVAREEMALISCDVDADPPEVKFHWRFNSSSDSSEVKRFTSNWTHSVAEHTPKSRFGYGTLYCMGENSIGRQDHPCQFTIIPAGPPDPLKACVVRNQSMSSLTVACAAGDSGGLRQDFILEVYSMDSILGDNRLQANLSKSDMPHFVVHSLPAGTSFSLVTYARNAKGRSPQVTLQASTLAEPAPHIHQSEYITEKMYINT